MKRFLFLLIAATLSFTACSVTRRVASTDGVSPWVGSNTIDIISAMGNPDRIDTDGRDGSILVYESTPDYDDPSYDILDPDSSTRKRQYAYFYLDDEGDCYKVDSNRDLPSAPRQASTTTTWVEFINWLVLLPLIIVVEIL